MDIDMEKVSANGQTEPRMMENGSLTKEKAKEHLKNKMVKSILEDGKMI